MAREVRFGVRLTGDAKGAVNAMRLTDKELGKLRRELDRTDNRVRRHKRGLQGWASGLMSVRNVLAPLAGVAGISLLARTTTNVIAQTAAISEQADLAGISAERLQELSKAFSDLAGVTEQKTNDALRRFNRRLGLAIEAEGPAKDAFGEMGVSMVDLSGNLRDTESVLEDVMRALAGIENDAVRAATASKFFGEDSGPQMAAALGQGTEAIEAQIQSLREHGRVMDEEVVRNARAANDELNAMRDAIGTQFNSAVLENVDALMSLADAFGLIAEKGIAALAAVTNFGEWIGESLAATIHGIAPDDIARLQSRRERLLEQLDRRGPARVGQLSNEAEVREELAEIESQLAAAYRERFVSLARQVRGQIPIFSSDLGGASAVDLPPITVTGTQPGDTSAAAPADAFPDDFQRLADRLDPVAVMVREYTADVAMLQEAMSRGLLSGEGYIEMLESLRGEVMDEASTGLGEVVKQTEELNDLGQRIGMTFSSAFEEAILSGNNFRDVLQGMLDDILRIMVRTAITAPIAEAAGGFFTGLLGRSGGGTVSSGTGYIVGERGPEMFVPRTSGTVIPNNAMGGVQVNVINNVGAEVTTREHATPQGPQIDVMIDRAVARNLSERGTDSNRALRSTFGTRPVRAGR